MLAVELVYHYQVYMKILHAFLAPDSHSIKLQDFFKLLILVGQIFNTVGFT